MVGVEVYQEECRRCGQMFEKDEPEPQLVCDRCLFKDWHEAEVVLEEVAE